MLSVLFFRLQHSLPHLLNLTYIGNKSERESKLKSSATQIVIKVIKRWSNKNQKSWKSPQFLLSLSFPPPKAIYSLLAIIRMVAMITKVMTFTNYNWWWIELIETHTIRILNFCLAFFLLWRNVEKFLDIFHCLVHLTIDVSLCLPLHCHVMCSISCNFLPDEVYVDPVVGDTYRQYPNKKLGGTKF